MLKNSTNFPYLETGYSVTMATLGKQTSRRLVFLVLLDFSTSGLIVDEVRGCFVAFFDYVHECDAANEGLSIAKDY